MNNSKLKKSFLRLVMWLLPLTFFMYQFILRLWPSLMMQHILERFSIDATGFGLLAAVYYYGYAGMQIPIAAALDRYPPRIVIALCAGMCAVGMYVFSFTQNWYLAMAARFLVGVGSISGFLGTSKVVSNWFPKSAYASMVGWTFSFGLLGAVYGGKPISVLIDLAGWQHVAIALSLLALAIGVAVYVGLKDPQGSSKAAPKSVLKFSDFTKLVRSPRIWLLGIANLLMVGALEGFADIWGVNYLMTAYTLPRSQAAQLISWIFFGMLVGGPLLTFFSKRLGLYLVIMGCGVGLAAAFYLLLYTQLPFNTLALAGLFFIIGILCCYQVLMFAAGNEFAPAQLLGVTVAFLNCLNMLGGSFFHTVIGARMDRFWTGSLQEGVRQYTLASYQSALWVVPACAAVGAFIAAGIGLQGKTIRKAPSNYLRSYD